jgi:hypothetical protein
VQTESQVVAVGHVIQLAVAPVFLLTGVSGLLGVLTNRLARIIDRARHLEERLERVDATHQERMHGELRLLSQRARLINTAVSLCTMCALLICGVIVALFVGAFLVTDVSVPIGLIFTAAMLALFIGLVSFLREIYVATRSLRRAALTSGPGLKRHDVSDICQRTDGASPHQAPNSSLRKVLRSEPAFGAQILVRLFGDRVPQSTIPVTPGGHRVHRVNREQPSALVGRQPAHFLEDALLVAHGAPCIGEAQGEVERERERNPGRVGGHKVDRTSPLVALRLGDVAPLVVDPDAQPDALAQQQQMAPGAAANVEHPHPWSNGIAENIDLGAHEALDGGRLRGGIECPVE